jgi:hypothetical protein
MRIPFWLLPNVLSLDAPAIALLWQGFFVAVFQAPVTWSARLTLGFTVWAIYISDRLLDTCKPQGDVLTTARHAFHRQHPVAMRWLLATAVVCATLLAWLQVRPMVFQGGIALSGAVVLYFVAVHLGYLPRGKELAVALLFSAGTILAPLARTERKTPLLIAGVAFCIACLANTVLIEAVESQCRRQERHAWLALVALSGLWWHCPVSRCFTAIQDREWSYWRQLRRCWL